MTTKTAAAGTFKSNGEDFLHLLDSRGNILCHIDADGVLYGSDYKTYGGLSLQSLSDEVMSGLPSVIDSGTF